MAETQMTQRERMLSGRLYLASDEELAAAQARARELVRRYNDTAHGDLAGRRALLEELMGSLGENVWIEPPFRCDYGRHISVGRNFFANYECIILDVCPVTIGDNVQL